VTVSILIGDVRDRLRSLPDESVHCVVTSPPYWGLRDYGVAGQIGLERTLGEHLDVMVNQVFAEVWRVLRKDGTCWVNYGDCYATTPNGRSAAATKAAGNDDRTFRDKPFSTIGPIYSPNHATARGEFRSGDRQSRFDQGGRVVAGGLLKPKDLCMIPNRFAIAMQDAGWWVRSEIIWHKPNPMPESIKDRPATSHEKVFLFSKSERYWYDAAAVRQERVQDEYANTFRGGSYVGGKPGKRAVVGNIRAHQTHGRHTLGDAIPEDQRRKKPRALTPRHEGHVNHTGLDETPRGIANLRNVWTIATAPFSEAHFATFPPDLPEICIKAGCPIGGTVLDPFLGAGTTAMVADRLGRNCIGIELNPEYAALAERRIKGDAGMFAQVAAQ
jgi:DNA modification methylase